MTIFIHCVAITITLWMIIWWKLQGRSKANQFELFMLWLLFPCCSAIFCWSCIFYCVSKVKILALILLAKLNGTNFLLEKWAVTFFCFVWQNRAESHVKWETLKVTRTASHLNKHTSIKTTLVQRLLCNWDTLKVTKTFKCGNKQYILCLVF